MADNWLNRLALQGLLLAIGNALAPMNSLNRTGSAADLLSSNRSSDAFGLLNFVQENLDGIDLERKDAVGK